MKPIDEEIWAYIDGTISISEKADIEAKIAKDPAYKSLYNELTEINQMMYSAEFEEPSMSFTRNVMEQVNLELAPVALKTKVNNNVIYTIAAFFVLSILSLLIYAAATSSSLTTETFNIPNFKKSINIGQFFTPASIRIFLFIDMFIALICLDGFIRSKKARYTTKPGT